MGAAVHLGVDDLGSLMEAACGAWLRWCAAAPELAVVQDLAELPDWTRHAGEPVKGDVLAKLAALTAQDAGAVTALVCLLIPGPPESLTVYAISIPTSMAWSPVSLGKGGRVRR